MARAKAVNVQDVLNNLTIRSRLCKYTDSERFIAQNLIQEIVDENKENDKKINDLILYDRGYPSAELMSMLMNNNISFVMRVARNYSNVVMKATKEDQLITIKHNKKEYIVRVLRFLLDSGEEEILLTNLIDDIWKIKDFKSLYFIRWGIEINFDDLKNKFEIENFSGKSKNTIEQDFYVTIYLSNMYEFIRMSSEALIQKRNVGKDLKYTYKQNKNILIGTVKEEFVGLFLAKNSVIRNRKLRKIIKTISKNTVPIRPNRHNNRKHTLVHTKYWMHKKRCL